MGEEYRRECDKRLDTNRWVSVWADGIYSGLRAEQTRLCALVVIGVNEHGKRRFLAIEDGVRESTQSWREILLKLKARGMNVPELAIGDGARGFVAALEKIYPETRQQRCWMHKTMNVLNYLPKLTQAKAKKALHAIWRAETRADLPVGCALNRGRVSAEPLPVSCRSSIDLVMWAARERKSARASA